LFGGRCGVGSKFDEAFIAGALWAHPWWLIFTHLTQL